MDAATELFASEGYANVSMRRIAERIEYAPSTLYLYFRDKEELCGTIVEEIFDRLSTILRTIQERADPPDARLRAGLRAYIEFGLQNPHHYRVAFGSGMGPPAARAPSAADRAGLRCFGYLERILAESRERGIIRRADLSVLAQTVWMFLHGVTDLLICSREIPNFPWAPVPATIDLAVELIMDSLQSGPGRAGGAEPCAG